MVWITLLVVILLELQVLELNVYDVHKESLHTKSHLPLSPGSCLTWFGFGEEGQLGSYDSKV